MSKTLDRLYVDHQRLRAVLETISKVCDGLGLDEFEAQADHLFCLIDYLLDYPDQVHHPMEDLVFDELLELDLAKGQLEKIKQNRAQHDALKSATSELMDLVEMASNDVELEPFLLHLQEYIAIQQQHMKFEEKEIFPLAKEYILPAVWEKLDERFSETSDPLFDKSDRRYDAIFQMLVPSEQHKSEMADPLRRYLTATGL